MTRYLQAQKLKLPLTLDAPEVARYVTDRVVGLGASRTRFVRAAVRIFLDADDHGYWRRRIGRAPEPVSVWLGSVLDEYTVFRAATAVWLPGQSASGYGSSPVSRPTSTRTV